MQTENQKPHLNDPRPAVSSKARQFQLALVRRLLDRGLLSVGDAEALADQAAPGDSLPDRLVARGISAEQVLELAGEVLDMPAVSLSATYGDPTIVELLPRQQAFELHAIPLYAVGQELTVVLSEPWDLGKLDEIRFITNRWIVPVFALRSDIERHLPLYYEESSEAGEGALEYAVGNLDLGGAAAESTAQQPDLALEGDEERPVVRLVNLVFKSALGDGATDIHLEPQETDLRVRYRLDGILQVKPFQIPKQATAGVVSRLKVLARINIAERRVPQDGKICLRFEGRRVDVRVSTFPTIHGEKVVMRLLDKDRNQHRLGNIGMVEDVLGPWRRALGTREGIVLVTGPTGSGKTSTLYASLQSIHRPEINVVTLENPVEYELPGIAQCQIDPASGMTFAAGLRAILRQDPDVIMVGEIRDRETAEVAMQAAQTGHLVLATMHTNDAPSAVTRLLDMGIPPYLVAGSVRAVLAQRLVRRLCPDCRRAAVPDAEEEALFRPWVREGAPFEDGAGCARCNGHGYQGRTGVHELLVVGRAQQALIARGSTDRELAASADGYRSMWWDGLEKARAGVTTLRELARWIQPDEAPVAHRTERVARLAVAGQA